MEMELKFGKHVIAHKFYSSRRLNSLSCEAVDLTYKVVKKNMSFDLAELTCLFFFVQKFFPSKGIVVWRKDVLFLYQINEYISELGEKYVNIMDDYFDAFKENMNNRFRIPKKLVDDYRDDICFMVDSEKVC